VPRFGVLHVSTEDDGAALFRLGGDVEREESGVILCGTVHVDVLLEAFRAANKVGFGATGQPRQLASVDRSICWRGDGSFRASQRSCGHDDENG
jgi:hypothetical protein